MDYSTKAFVIHDGDGEIISVGRPAAKLRGKLEIRSTTPGHSVVEIELSLDQSTMSVADLHKSHTIDMESKRLIRK